MTNKVFTIVRKDSKIYFKNGNKGMQFLHIAPITPYGSNTYWSFRNLKFYNKENVEMKVTSYKTVSDYNATFVLDGKINATVEAKANSVYGSTYNITCLFQDTIYGSLYTGYGQKFGLFFDFGEVISLGRILSSTHVNGGYNLSKYEVYADENDKRLLFQGTGTNAGYDKLDMDWRDLI